MAAIHVSEEPVEPSLAEEFERLRTNDDMAAVRERIAAHVEKEPDKVLGFIAEMDLGVPEGDGPVVYACPMHPEVVSASPTTAPSAG